VWVVIILAIVYWWFGAGDQAQVFLETPSGPQVQATGLVQINGAPADNGLVYVLFEDPKKNRHLSGEILQVGADGTFATKVGQAAENRGTPAPLRVTATFSGQKNQKDKSPKAINGKAIVYLNYPPPVGRWTLWICIIASCVFAIGLITLFTGDLTRRKSRILFSITYIMTFLSLAVPIGTIILVSKSQYAVEMMEEAPVGLIKGTAKGVQSPQWLVNVGGAVSPKQVLVPQVATNVTPGTGPQPSNEPPLTPATIQKPQPANAPTPEPTPRPDELRQTPGFAMVQGGLAVPFYVIILAMLGAGINMTKKVPDIQKRHDMEALPEDRQSMVAAALTAPVAALVNSAPRIRTAEGNKAVSGIRKDLIDTYMGLISAPFLAIAVYYLLQIVATNIAEPVLVLVAFATGFISDSIVTAITDIASDMLKRRPKNAGQGQNGATEESAAAAMAASAENP